MRRQTGQEKKAQEMDNVSWATGEFFPSFLFHSHFTNNVFRYYFELLTMTATMTTGWQGGNKDNGNLTTSTYHHSCEAQLARWVMSVQ
jgi:hypothetical protein